MWLVLIKGNDLTQCGNRSCTVNAFSSESENTGEWLIALIHLFTLMQKAQNEPNSVTCEFIETLICPTGQETFTLKCNNDSNKLVFLWPDHPSGYTWTIREHVINFRVKTGLPVGTNLEERVGTLSESELAHRIFSPSRYWGDLCDNSEMPLLQHGWHS